MFSVSLTRSVLLQEINLACELLLHEGRSLNPSLGELVPVAVHPGQAGTVPILVEEEMEHRRRRRRRVFLTSSPNEDFFWAVGSIGFIIDAGLEKRYASFSVLLFQASVNMHNLVYWQFQTKLRVSSLSINVLYMEIYTVDMILLCM